MDPDYLCYYLVDHVQVYAFDFLSSNRIIIVPCSIVTRISRVKTKLLDQFLEHQEPRMNLFNKEPNFGKVK